MLQWRTPSPADNNQNATAPGERARDERESSLAYTRGSEGAVPRDAAHDLSAPFGTPFVSIEVPDHPPTIPGPPSGFTGGGR